TASSFASARTVSSAIRGTSSGRFAGNERIHSALCVRPRRALELRARRTFLAPLSDPPAEHACKKRHQAAGDEAAEGETPCENEGDDHRDRGGDAWLQNRPPGRFQSHDKAA